MPVSYSPLRHSGETIVTEKFRSPHEGESKIVLNSEFQGGFRIQKGTGFRIPVVDGIAVYGFAVCGC